MDYSEIQHQSKQSERKPFNLNNLKQGMQNLLTQRTPDYRNMETSEVMSVAGPLSPI